MIKLLLIVCCFFISICSTILEVSPDGGNYPIRARLDEKLIIRLAGSPSTGFAWNEIEVPESLIMRQSTGFESRKDNRLGGAGYFYYNYDPVSVGKGTLKFMYSREWENPNDALAIRKFTEVQISIYQSRKIDIL